MTRARPQSLVLAIGAAVVGALTASSTATAAHDFAVVRVAAALARPVFLTAPPGDTSRVFVVEQHTGKIRILRRDTWKVDATPFLTISGVSTGGEQGLLGLAFHPDFATNGFFYVHLTNPDTRVVRYSVSADPNVANPASGTPVLSFAQPQTNHNGGWIGFGVDGYLYIASGDGGNGDDTGAGHTLATGNAQDLTSNRLGKILRVDVDTDGFPTDSAENWAAPPDNPFVGIAGDDEIWVYGLRNPWRASFDRSTGDFYIGDVGQGACEEVNIQPASSAGGENYGWRLREGVVATPSGGVGGTAPAGAINPFLDYSHGGAVSCSSPPSPPFSGFAVTGGYVYRGPAASLQGRYFFADFARGRLWSAVWNGLAPSSFNGRSYTSFVDHGDDPAFLPDAGTIGSISSFGEDSDGNLYVLDLNDGEVFVVPEPKGELALWAAVGAMAWTGAWRRTNRRAGSGGGRGHDHPEPLAPTATDRPR